MKYINKLKQYINNINDNVNESDDTSFAVKYLSAFGIIKNTTKLFNSEYNEECKHLEVLNGLRVISMLWIIYFHTFLYMLKGAIVNLKDFLDLGTMFTFNSVFAATLAVDIFFWISGFLALYLLMLNIKKKNGEMQNPIMYLVHRFIRLTPLYAFVLLLHWTLMASVGNGPIFFLYEKKEVSAWHSTWWLRLTYSNNIPEIHDDQNDCMDWTWYLSNNMQYFLFIPITAYLLYHKRILGVLFIVFYQLIWYGLTLYFVIKYDLNLGFKYLDHNFYKLLEYFFNVE